MSRVTNPIHALPLGVADAHKDITRVLDQTVQSNVGYSSLAAPSSIIGYAMLGGGEPADHPRDGSYVDILIDDNPAEPGRRFNRHFYLRRSQHGQGVAPDLEQFWGMGPV